MFGRARHIRPRQEFDQVALPHLDSLYGAALRLCKNERDSEDLVQDAMLRAFRSFGQFERGSNARAWLYKILVNTFINGYRRRQRERVVLAEAETDPAAVWSQAGIRDPEALLLQRRVAERVREALDALPEDFRVAVVLADLEEFSYRE